MYRLLLYYLILLVVAGFIYSVLGILSFSPLNLAFNLSFILLLCGGVNVIFAKIFRAQTNLESIYISALILTLVIKPISNLDELAFLFWVCIWTVASKYILAINRKHLFNPVGFGILLPTLVISGSANWWVGTLPMLPFVLLGVLIVKKIRRFSLVFSFLLISLIITLSLGMLSQSSPIETLQKALFYSPLFFFAFVMLTEPLTTPPNQLMQIAYGFLVGILFSPKFHIGGYYTSPEIALIIGNIFSYLVSPKYKLFLKLKEKIRLGPDIYDFVFESSKISFQPGQYLEWTLSYPSVDSRGNRRFFTIASSPTEQNLRIGVKLNPKSSGFKSNLFSLQIGKEVVASQLSGSFTMPKDQNKKLVFIAGGIGVTPFRSMVKYLIDNNERRNIVLFYCNKLISDIVYANIFREAFFKFGLKTIYTLTDLEKLPPGWTGQTGFISEEIIRREVPDFKDRIFYLSGPHAMVATFEKTLKQMGVSKNQVKTDYFPGFA